MRLAILTLSAAAVLAGCEPAEPSPAPAPSAAPAPSSASNLGPPAQPEITLRRMTPGEGDSEEARRQAEASIRELDRSAATIGPDIANARRQAEEAVRRAAPRPPPAPPNPAPREPAVEPAPAAPPPAPVTPATPGG